MNTVPATHLKNRLGAVLRQAALGPVAVERHGRVVAWLVPPPDMSPQMKAGPANSPSERSRGRFFGRAEEDRLLTLAASGDFRLSRWRRAGDPELLSGLAATLASVPGFDALRMLVLAEQLHPGMSRADQLSEWLSRTPLRLDRFLPQLAQRMRN